MLGFVLGLVAPRKAAAAVTSVAGAGLAFVSGVWLLNVADVVHPSRSEHASLIAMGIWMGIALAGFVFQLPRKRSGPKAAEAA